MSIETWLHSNTASTYEEVLLNIGREIERNKPHPLLVVATTALFSIFFFVLLLVIWRFNQISYESQIDVTNQIYYWYIIFAIIVSLPVLLLCIYFAGFLYMFCRFFYFRSSNEKILEGLIRQGTSYEGLVTKSELISALNSRIVSYKFLLENGSGVCNLSAYCFRLWK
jgi:hypothetical protein